MRILLFIIYLAAVAAARGSDVVLSSNFAGPAVFDSTNTFKVPNGSLVRVGMILNTADPAGSFVEFGISTVKNAGFGPNARPGKITGSVTQSGPESTHGAFDNRTIFLWVFNTPVQADATEQGIFGTSEVFPVNDIAGVGDFITVSSGTQILTTLPLPGFTTAQILPGDAHDSKHFVLGRAIPPAITLTAEASAPSIDGTPRLLLRAKNLDPSEPVILQASTDLSHWSPLLTFPPGERSEVAIDVPVDASRKYFRLAK